MNRKMSTQDQRPVERLVSLRLTDSEIDTLNSLARYAADGEPEDPDMTNFISLEHKIREAT